MSASCTCSADLVSPEDLNGDGSNDLVFADYGEQGHRRIETVF